MMEAAVSKFQKTPQRDPLMHLLLQLSAGETGLVLCFGEEMSGHQDGFGRHHES